MNLRNLKTLDEIREYCSVMADFFERVLKDPKYKKDRRERAHAKEEVVRWTRFAKTLDAAICNLEQK